MHKDSHSRLVFLGLVLGVVAAAIFAVSFRRALPTEPSLFIVREIAAPDHVWYVDPATGTRRFIGSDQQAWQVIDAVAATVDARELALLPTWDVRVSDAEAEAIARWKGRFVRDPGGSAWYVHEIAKRRERVPAVGTLWFLHARSRELSRLELREVPVSGESPSWLDVPEGYEADIVAGELSHPRVLGWDPAGRLAVSEHIERGTVSTFAVRPSGPFERKIVLDGIPNAHGFVFHNGRLIVAGERSVDSWSYDAGSGALGKDARHLMSLPPGGERFPGEGHRTRTLVVGRDGWLYLSIGSDCDHCAPTGKDAYARIIRFDERGQKTQTVASGLRNAVFFVETVAGGAFWANEMGRDDLGEDLPPDELDLIQSGKNYGWPACYGARIPVPPAVAPACVATEPPSYEYRAHSAPLGIRIIPAAFDPALAGDLIVALHGSTLRTRSVAGYKVVRIELDEAGRPVAEHDLITGFLKGENVPAGRPVDLLFGSDGTLYLTDDHAGVVHRIRKK